MDIVIASIINKFIVKKDIINFLNHFKISNFEGIHYIGDSIGDRYSIKKYY